MELKLSKRGEQFAPLSSSNRTFMELKSGIAGKDGKQPNVLIVPLWN